MNTIELCRAAWQSSKKDTQPDYDDLVESYRDMLAVRAEVIAAARVVEDGPFAGFENAVLDNLPSQLTTEPEPELLSEPEAPSPLVKVATKKAAVKKSAAKKLPTKAIKKR